MSCNNHVCVKMCATPLTLDKEFLIQFHFVITFKEHLLHNRSNGQKFSQQFAFEGKKSKTLTCACEER